MMTDVAATIAIEEPIAECLRLIDRAHDMNSYAVASSKVSQLPQAVPDERYDAILNLLECKRQEIAEKLRGAG